MQYPLPVKEGETPYRWQKECFEKLVPLEFGAVLAEVGTGKSTEVMYLTAAHYLAKEIDAVLLFAPASMYKQWVTEQLPLHCPVPYEAFFWDSGASGNRKRAEEFIAKKTDALKFLVVDVEAMSHTTYISLFRGYLKSHRAALVIDEATRIKNTGSKRTVNICVGLNDLQYYGRVVANFYYTSVYRYILTGTVVTNHPYDLFSLFSFLKHNFWGVPENVFRKRFGVRRLEEARNRKFWKDLTKEDIRLLHSMLGSGMDPALVASSQGVDYQDVLYIRDHPSMTLPWKHLDELSSRIAPYSYSILLKDCFDEVPEEQDIVLSVPMSEAQQKAYRELKANLLARIGTKQITAANKAVLSMICQRVTGGFASATEITDPDDESQLIQLDAVPSKYTVMKEDMEESGEYPVIVFCRFVAEAKYIEEHLSKDIEGITTALVIGEVPKAKREEHIQNFKDGNIQVLIANPQCLSIGQNLQVSHIEYLYSLSYSSEDYTQLRGRIRRATQKKSVCIYKSLVCPGTVDEHVQDVLKDKGDLLDYFQSKSLKDIL